MCEYCCNFYVNKPLVDNASLHASLFDTYIRVVVRDDAEGICFSNPLFIPIDKCPKCGSDLRKLREEGEGE